MKRSASITGRTPILRTRMRPVRIVRDWTLARAKVEAAGRCRIGLDCEGPIEAAHLIGRALDPRDPDRPHVRIVPPDLVVPLCRAHHRRYDAHELDLRPHLTDAEREAACARRPDAERRLAGRAWREETSRA